MQNFIKFRKSLPLLLFTVALSYNVSGQESADSKASSDTATIVNTVKEVSHKGPKVSGVVIDANSKKPMVGANVGVAGFSATITDEKGKFTVSLPQSKATLSVSIEGYHQKLVPASVGKQVSIVLYPLEYTSQYTTADLPYQSVSKARSVAAIEVINTKGGWNANSETPDTYFQGQLAGANVIRRSGTPGMGSNIFVRGFNSLYAGTKPLYVVDGVVYDVNSYGSSLHTGHVNNPLQFIDVHDIASVTVAKDAASTAVFGTRAANGVVFINTNHARSLETKIDFAVFSGINQAVKNLPLMNAYDYRVYLADILRTQGLSNSTIENQPYMIEDSNNPNYYTYHKPATNWQNEVFAPSLDQSYSLRVSGGDNVAKYVLSAGLTDDRGVIDNTKNTRYNTRFNGDLNLTKRLSGNVNLSFSYSEQALRDQGVNFKSSPITLALVKSPFLSKYAIDALGNVSPNFADYDTLQVSNPVAILDKGINQTKALRFFGSISFDYKLSKSVKISNVTGVSYDKAQETLFIPDKGVVNDTLSTTLVAKSIHGTQSIRYYSLYDDLNLSWNKVYDRVHRLSATIGSRVHTNQTEQDYAYGINSATDNLISINNSNPVARDLGGNIGEWNVVSGYFSGNYSYADKYLLNLSASVDGSSRFGKNNKYAVMPAIGAAWVISSEDFLANVEKLDLLKLRISYGWVGNDEIGNYTSNRYYTSQNLFGVQGLKIANLGNANIKWETVRKANAGVDLSILDERLNLSVDYWNHRTSNLLTYATTATITPVSGISSFIENAGSMESQGFDFNLNGRVVSKKSFKWDAGLNLGVYKNKVKSLPNGAFITPVASGYFITREGSAANLFYGYKTNGVYASDAEAAASGLLNKLADGSLVPFRGGDVKFVNSFDSEQDVANSVKIIDENDMQVIGDPNPDISGGLSNTFTYKRWSLNALLTFSSGNDVYNYTRSVLESGSNYYNQSPVLNNRWKGDGQSVNTPRAEYGDPSGNARFSDRWIEKGSYLRLRTVVICV